MSVKDMHELECPRCRIGKEFYEHFNSDSKKNVSYFGVISYVNSYLVMPVSSDQPKELSEISQSCKSSNVCFLQLINEWAFRREKQINRKNGLIKHLKEKKKQCLKPPPFYFPQDTGNFMTIKKSESFTSSPEDTLCSVNLKTTKDVCKLTKKSPSKEKVARKEPKEGTLKRKRWNWNKLKQNESYADDLFEDKKLKRLQIEDSSHSEEDKIVTPRWSVQISPRMQSRSPSYEDCYSPTELQAIRKEAEEYQHSRNKRRIKEKEKGIRVSKKNSTAKMKEDPETYKILEKVRDKLQKLEKKDCESEEDDYYPDEED